jgi:hypothetical protein
MSAEERQAALTAGSNVRFIRHMHRIWKAVQDTPKDAAPGRLFVAEDDTKHGYIKTVGTRSTKRISKQYDCASFFIMDATLPSWGLLRHWFPEVEITGRIDAETPHVTYRQVLGVPNTKTKLLEQETNQNLVNIKRYILRRWLETGCGKTLVIVQKDVEEPLAALGLPDNVHLEHFGAIEGIDGYKDARLVILVGRREPPTQVMEAEDWRGRPREGVGASRCSNAMV